VKKSLPHALIPVFSTTVERTTLPIRLGDAELELALDRGRIAANGHGQPIDEIEIELKSGASAALADVAERLARTIPVAWQPRSKAERGYGLAAGTDDLAVRAAPIVLDPGVSTAGAARIIALSCLHHALANAAAVRDEQPQGVHQMRVGLRRLRAALSVFKDVLRDAGTDSIKTELKWLTEQLGPARDSYVLIEQRVRPLLGAAAFAGPAAVLERDLLAEHDANLCHAIAVIDSDRYRALGTRVALWLANGDWARTDDPLMRARRECPARDFAARCLQRRLRKILKKAKKIRTLQPRARHKLRIAVKKLRYATDFFASLFPGSTRKFRRRLKTVQSLLGTLNDSEVHKRLAATIVTADRGDGEAASKALAMGLIVGREDMTVGSCLAELEVAVPRLAKSPAFWR
jgi:inorganic triphosphatase YgiF